MRLATYNVEWFDALFDDAGTLLADGAWSSRHDVTRAEQAEALGIVFTAMDADAVMVIEAPDTNSRRSTTRALTTFAETFDLRTRAVVTGFANDTQQEIALLYDPDALTVRHDPKTMQNAPRFDGEFEIDLDVDATLDHVRFSKPPLELAVQTASGVGFRMIGAHLKSKAPHGARSRDEVMRVSIANRRKQLAQAIWLRRRVAAHLDAGTSLIVLGDLNDGPGLDEFEHLFGRSRRSRSSWGRGRRMRFMIPHAASARPAPQDRCGDHHVRGSTSPRRKAVPAGAAWITSWCRQEFARAQRPEWRIWHPFDDPALLAGIPELRDALITASDHFPVTLDIALCKLKISYLRIAYM